jgi:hypothetical protein
MLGVSDGCADPVGVALDAVGEMEASPDAGELLAGGADEQPTASTTTVAIVIPKLRFDRRCVTDPR